MSDPILSDEERDVAFEAGLPAHGLTDAQKDELRAEHDREMAERENGRHDAQKHYERHKGRH